LGAKFSGIFKNKNKYSDNTIRVYLAELSHIFVKLVSQKLIKNSPFNDFKMPSKPQLNTEKAITEATLATFLSLSDEAIRKIVEDAPTKYTSLYTMAFITERLSMKQSERLTREINDAFYFFTFCFFCRGINFTDAALLLRTNTTETIQIERHKTAKKVSNVKKMTILKTEILEKIIGKLENTEGSHFLFSALNGLENQSYTLQRKRIDEKMYLHNKYLSVICAHLGISKLTIGAARHTYATLLKSKYNSETALVSYALDHRTITSHYISDNIMQEKFFKLDRQIAADFGQFMTF
jgi:integrase